MTRLEIKQGSSYHEVDTEDIVIQLNYGLKELRDVGNIMAPFSLSFNLPFTNRNTAFFGAVHDPSQTGGLYEWSEKADCRLYEDDMLVLEGTMNLESVDLAGHSYQCTIFSGEASFYDTIKGKTWEDVWRDSSGNPDCPFDHALTPTNIEFTWADGSLGLLGGMPVNSIRYAMFDTGTQYLGDRFPAAETSWVSGVATNNGGVDPTCLRPALRVDWLLDELFGYTGYTRKDDCFFKTDTYEADNLWVIIGTQFDRMPVRNSYGFRVQAPETLYTANEESVVSFTQASGDGLYDTDSLWFSPQIFIPSFTGMYLLSFELSSTDAAIALPVTVRVYNDDQLIGTAEFTLDQIVAGVYFSVYVNLTQNANTFITLEVPALSSNIGVIMSFVDYAYGNFEGILDGAKAMGTEGLDVWVKALCDKFNLALITNAQERTAKFVTYDDNIPAYKVDASHVDWSSKVNLDGHHVLQSGAAYQKARLKFTDAESKDHKNLWYQQKFGYQRGEYSLFARNDYAEGKEDIGGFFTPMRLTKLKDHWLTDGTADGFSTNLDIILMEGWSVWDGQGVSYEKLGPILCFYHGDRATGAPGISVGSVNTEAITASSVPLFTPYSGVEGDADIYTLDWSVPAPDLIDTSEIGLPQKGVIGKFWYNYLQVLYSKEARVLECDVFLDALDIFQLDFGKRVRINEQLYRLISVRNYTVGAHTASRVTLLKETAVVLSECGLTPAVQGDGRVTWTDGNGSTQPPNAYCCTAWGYSWDSDSETCSIFAGWGQEEYVNVFDIQADDGSGTVANRVMSTAGNTPYSMGGAVRASTLGSFKTTDYKFTAQTSSFAQTLAANNAIDLERQVFVGRDAAVRVEVRWMAVCSDESSSNFGESDSGMVIANVYTQGGVSTKQQTVVSEIGPGNCSVSVDNTDGTYQTQLDFEVSGPARTMDWTLDIRIISFQASHSTGLPLAYYQDGIHMIYQDGDSMRFA